MSYYAANRLRLTYLAFNNGDYRRLFSIVLFYIVCFSSLRLMIVKSPSYITRVSLHKFSYVSCYYVQYPWRKKINHVLYLFLHL